MNVILSNYLNIDSWASPIVKAIVFYKMGMYVLMSLIYSEDTL